MDFDVSTRACHEAPNTEKLYNDRVALPAPTGHPEETSEQGSDRAAGPDRCSLRVQEEGGGGTDRPKGQDRESPRTIKANSPKARQFFVFLKRLPPLNCQTRAPKMSQTLAFFNLCTVKNIFHEMLEGLDDAKLKAAGG